MHANFQTTELFLISLSLRPFEAIFLEPANPAKNGLECPVFGLFRGFLT